MASIHSTPQSAQDQQVQQLKIRVAMLESENQRLRQHLSWEDRLFSNPHLSAGHKLALRAAAQTLHKAEGATPNEVKKIYIPALAQKVGLSPKTTGKLLQFLATAGALIRETSTETDHAGQRVTRVSIGLTEAVKYPEKIQPPLARNHGGQRKQCPSCGSEQLIEERIIICTDCGSVISRTTKPTNPPSTAGQDDLRIHTACEDDQCQGKDRAYQHPSGKNQQTLVKHRINLATGQDNRRKETTPPTPNFSALYNQKEPMDNLTIGDQKPATPPKPPAATCFWQEAGEREQRDQTVKLLLDIAGDEGEHIIMPGGQGKKYTTVHRPLTSHDIAGHLAGTKTVGATLHHADTTARALCFDTDDNPTDSVTFQQVQEAAALLVASGYQPLLEPSPAGRGGHLWIIFSERVNARAAYKTVCEIAPALKGIAEYWPAWPAGRPGRGNRKVRLLAGKYVTPLFTAWTQVRDAQGNIIKTRDLLGQQTPASLIPALVPVEDEPEPEPSLTWPERAPHHTEEECHVATAPNLSSTPDGKHRTKYGNHTMWVEWPSEQYLINRFNSEHTIDELATYERNGMINASIIGRPERTASVAVTRDGQRFTDFGAGARTPEGHQDGGDAFEFFIRSRNLNKKDVLRELGQALNKEASCELLRAARAGELPLPWIMEILTDKGREVYNQNARSCGCQTLEEQYAGGVAGFSKAYPPPNRRCLVCGQRAWVWTGNGYHCPHPERPKNTSN